MVVHGFRRQLPYTPLTQYSITLRQGLGVLSVNTAKPSANFPTTNNFPQPLPFTGGGTACAFWFRLIHQQQWRPLGPALPKQKPVINPGCPDSQY